VRKLNSDNLIKAIAYYRIDSKHCFLFPMAEHGNLWDFWAARRKKKEHGESHRGDNMFLVWVFTQLVGVANALVELHGDVPNIRHGDLKPENILCFQDGSYAENADDLGEQHIRLVITDVGISKGHQGPTQKRAVTSTVISTTRYEPPEMDRTREDGTELSRRYDVWSLGCIVLEFLIWLLYDFDELDNFTAALKDRFYESDKKGIRIHPTVSEWIKRIKDDEKNCQEGTPSRKLVSLIEEKLLVVKVETLPGTLREVVPVESPRNQILRKFRDKLRKSQQATEKIAEMMGRRRASAKDTRDELGKILEDVKQQKYKIKREG
jgi:serine/threonine protein kinase